MSISSEITRIGTLRNNIRTVLNNFGLSASSSNITECASKINDISVQTTTTLAQGSSISSNTYLSGNVTIAGDANLLAENIKNGVTIFGVTGTL